MEHKLEKYRAQQRRIEFYENFKAKLRKMVSFGNNDKKEDEEHVIKIVIIILFFLFTFGTVINKHFFVTQQTEDDNDENVEKSHPSKKFRIHGT